VACHAYRLGGGAQDVFASASGMGVRCNRDDLAFFPDVYNEDWFFFSEEAAGHKIAKVGVSRQRKYDPYEDPNRAAQEEFGDLLAEGLYARLDINEDISEVDTAYWGAFIESRIQFHDRVAAALSSLDSRKLAFLSWRAGKAGKAEESMRAARDQLDQITPSVCQKFVELWQSDLIEWRRYLLTKVPHADSIVDAFKQLELDYLGVNHEPSLISTRYRKPWFCQSRSRLALSAASSSSSGSELSNISWY
jgi:hypothetical protein